MNTNKLSATGRHSTGGWLSNLLSATMLVVVFALPVTASALPVYSNLFVFGDSLADSGNNAIVLDGLYGPGVRTPAPIPSPAFIPDYPYASNRYSNGPVWTEQFASSLGLSAQPSLAGGTNFAFGGARMGPAGSSFPYTVSDQVALFKLATGGVAPASALYVVEGGGNDARDAFAILAGGGDPTMLINTYVASTIGILTQLKLAGAQDILLANIPDIGKAPAIQALGGAAVSAATLLVVAMNAAVEAAMLGQPLGFMSGVHELDLFGLIDNIYNNPAAYGMTDATSACAYSPACITDPATTFFWDGIHPTTAGHALIASAALAAIPEPATPVLIFIGLAGFCFIRLRKSVSRESVHAETCHVRR